MTEQATMTLAQSVLTLIGTMFSGWMAYLVLRLNRQGAAAAERAQTVADKLTESNSTRNAQLGGIAATTRATHKLVNGASGVQLRLYALAVRRIAELTQDPADAKVADEADQMYHDHLEAQKVVDSVAVPPERDVEEASMKFAHSTASAK